MKYFVLISLILTCYVFCNTTITGTNTTEVTNPSQTTSPIVLIIQYLFDHGYIGSLNCTRRELRRSLRQFQREYNFTINDQITPEVSNFVMNENQKMVIDYLKTYNYILGSVTPSKIIKAVTVLQQNSGTLNVTGLIDPPTIHFVRTRPQAYSEGLFAD